MRGSAFQEAPGGRGANQAIAAARLGARAALVARVGADDRGAALLDRLAFEGVDSTHVLTDTGAATGLAVIQADASGGKQTVTVDGANARLAPADIHDASALVRGARVLLLQLDAPLETVIAAASLGRDAGARVVLDPAPPAPLPGELLELVDLIKPNSAEAAVLTGVDVHDRHTARDAARRLLNGGAGVVAIEAGRSGNLLLWPGGECWLPIIPVESVDTTGAGDAFAAAMAVMLAEGRSLEEAGPFASTAAALTTTLLGAQASLPRRDAVITLLARTGTAGAETTYRVPSA